VIVEVIEVALQLKEEGEVEVEVVVEVIVEVQLGIVPEIIMRKKGLVVKKRCQIALLSMA
jgi:hypothetical protein